MPGGPQSSDPESQDQPHTHSASPALSHWEDLSQTNKWLGIKLTYLLKYVIKLTLWKLVGNTISNGVVFVFHLQNSRVFKRGSGTSTVDSMVAEEAILESYAIPILSSLIY